MAPLPKTDYGWAPGGIFKTFPPAVRLSRGRRCNVQRIAEVHGFVLPPGAEARVLLLMAAAKAGTFSFPSHQIAYEEDGQLFSQTLEVGIDGTISPDTPLRMNTIEKPCTHLVKVLPSGA
jgi:hypothetical protein